MIKTVEIDGSNLDVFYPSSWEEMTVKQYIVFDSLNNEKEKSLLLLITEYIEKLNGFSIRKMKNKDFQDLLKDMSFINKELPLSNQITCVIIRDEKYNLIDFNNITVAESIDISSLTSADNVIPNLGKLFCINHSASPRGLFFVKPLASLMHNTV